MPQPPAKRPRQAAGAGRPAPPAQATAPAQAKRPARPRANAARRAAVDALVQLHRGRFSSQAAGALSRLAGRNAAFAGALFFGTAERVVTLDALLTPHLKQPLHRLDAEVRAILEAGLYQALYMRVPARAAVSESVALARAVGKTSAAGLVNAVLRRAVAAAQPSETPSDGAPATVTGAAAPITAALAPSGEGTRAQTVAASPHGAAAPIISAHAPSSAAAPQAAAGPSLAALEPFTDALHRLSVVYSVSQAVAGLLVQALGQAEAEAFLAASFATGEVCLRANTQRLTPEQLKQRLAARGVATRWGRVPGALYARLPGGVARDADFAAGLYYVQGEASQLACACLAPAAGHRVLDVCAAPGGKSATLAQAAGAAGLTACDLRPARVQMITQLFARLGLEGARVLCQDATVYQPALAGQDRVLCDVPCSSLGVLAQKPDLRLATGQGIEALPAVQLKVLQTACRYVKEGGRLLYSTCTVRPQENAQVVRQFLAGPGGAGFALVPPGATVPGALLNDGMMTLLPQHTGTDGFFIAVMERRAAP